MCFPPVVLTEILLKYTSFSADRARTVKDKRVEVTRGGETMVTTRNLRLLVHADQLSADQSVLASRAHAELAG